MVRLAPDTLGHVVLLLSLDSSRFYVTTYSEKTCNRTLLLKSAHDGKNENYPNLSSRCYPYRDFTFQRYVLHRRITIIIILIITSQSQIIFIPTIFEKNGTML